MDSKDVIREIMLFFLFLLFYFLPTIIAAYNQKRNYVAILFFNLFLGWTILGWFIAFIWGLMKDSPPSTIIYQNRSE